MKRLASVLAAACLLAWTIPAPAQVFPYELRYDLTLESGLDRAQAKLTLGEGSHNSRWMRSRTDPERHSGFEADGELAVEDRYDTWTPPPGGGSLSFDAKVNHRRGSGGRYDARITADWAVFRGDNIFPPARVRQEAGSEAEATLHVHLPEDWTFVAAFPEVKEDVYLVENPERGFDRPTGWMAAGRLGVRRERISGVQVAVAGPFNQGVRRMDILAFMNWNLPEIRDLLRELPDRLVVVSAGEQMWRGGLSGPDSLYLHADRPLLSENGTSTLMHELMHVATGLGGSEYGDWIVEGLAEYYTLKLMWRSGTITKSRYQTAFRKLAKWSEDVSLDDLKRDESSGAVTARSVLLMRELDREIHRRTDKKKSLDDVLRLLVDRGRDRDLDAARFNAAVSEVMGKQARTLKPMLED